MGGSTPFGYKVNKNKKLILDREQSPWVEKIFKWYSQGLSPKRIKHKLDGNVLTNRGKPIWSYGSVEAILRNTHPNGSYVYYEKEIPCPRIVDSDTWDKVQTRLEKKKRMKRGRQIKIHDYPLRDVLKCGHCDTQMGGRSKKLKNDKHRSTYLCVEYNRKWKESSKDGDWKRNKYCENNVSMECEPTEEVIWETLKSVLKLSHQERELFKRMVLKEKKQSRESKDKQIEKLKSLIERNQDTLSLLEDRIVEKEIEKISSREKAKQIQTFIDKLQEESHKLSLEILSYKNELVVLENDNLWINWIEDYHNNIDRLDSLSRDEKLEEIKKYIKEIRVFFNSETRKHRLELNFKLPIIDDTFNWKDKLKKKKGYTIGQGSNQNMIELDNNVRHIRTQ